MDKQEEDAFFMGQALEEAKKAFSLGEVPIGAVLVLEGKVIARAHNLVETRQDASAHAEVLCLQNASKFLNNWRLSRSTLYSTLEPCAMCAGALLLFRVHTLVWAAPDLRHGAHGSWVNLLDLVHPTHRLEVRRGKLGDEAAHLMKEFFQRRRCCGSSI